MKVTLEGNELVIRIPANTTNPPLSSSGKTLIIASTNGNRPTSVEVNGSPVTIGLNAYIPNPKYVAPPK